MIKRKRWTALILGMAVMASVTACSGGATSSGGEDIQQGETSDDKRESGKRTITAWAWDPAYNIIALNKAKAIYEKENPDVTIEVVEMAKADIEQKLSTMLASGQKDVLPDIVLVEDYNAVKYMNAYPGSFVAYDNVDFSQFASPVDFMTVDNETYGVPFGLATAGLYYRTDYLQEAGFEDKDLQNITWDRFIQIGKVVKEKTGHNIVTFDPNDSSYIRMMLQSAGQWYTNEEGKANIKDNVVLKEAFNTIVKMQEADIVKPSTGWAEFVKAFNSGDVAAVLTGCWITPSVMAVPEQSGLWKIAPMPRLDNVAESVNASNLGGSSWFVLSGTGNEALAKDFIGATFAGSVELYDKILKENGIASMYAPAFTSDAYTEPQEFFGGQTTNKDLAEWTKSVKPVSFGEYTWEADAIISQGLAAVLAGEDIEKVLEDAENQFNMQIQ